MGRPATVTGELVVCFALQVFRLFGWTKYFQAAFGCLPRPLMNPTSSGPEKGPA